MWWMSSCITVVLDELAELCALLDVLGLVVGELKIAQLPLCFARGVGGARERRTPSAAQRMRDVHHDR